ncbi:DMT family transporter [Alphaproteobacteria bacterium]|nr:DMT family transporter [Alphaproteobacteria bacterium]
MLLLFILSAIWGSAFIAIKISLDYFSPTSVASYRLIIASFFLLFFYIIGNYKNLLTRYDVAMLVFVGVVGNFLPFYLISWSEQHIQSSTAGILMGVGPILTLILSHFFTKDDKFNTSKLISIFIGFIGVIFIFEIDIFFNISSSNSIELLSKFLIILAALGYMTSNIVAYNALKHIDSFSITFFATFFGAIVSIPFLIVSEFNQPSFFSIKSLLPIIYLGIFPTAIAFQIRYHITKTSGPVFLSYVAYLIPIFALIWGFLLLSERIYTSSFVGIVLILVGVYVGRKNQ